MFFFWFCVTKSDIIAIAHILIISLFSVIYEIYNMARKLQNKH
jgi:hypothetical protein